ncbi:MAG: Trm112 family protein [Candidatus Vecturithrix sp.]|nr:Trm112 family protein [Candidatus Vecturithrix sp.]
MAINQLLLDMLACPETKEPISLADETLVAKLNAAIAAGALKNRIGEVITEKIDGGLVRQDQQYLYPIRDDIPVMLIDEGIPLNQL